VTNALAYYVRKKFYSFGRRIEIILSQFMIREFIKMFTAHFLMMEMTGFDAFLQQTKTV